MLLIVPIFTPENHTLLPAFNPLTSLKTVDTTTFLENRFCCPPNISIPATNMIIPTSTKSPTMIVLLFSAAFISYYVMCRYKAFHASVKQEYTTYSLLFNKIVIVKRFHPFVFCIKNILEISFPFKPAIKQHHNAIANRLGTRQVVRDDNGRCFVF